MSSALLIEDLVKRFATGKPAVDGVSFDVPAGEIVVLLGPSGCGKTTTLRCVAGLEHPTGGRISIGDRIVSEPERGVLVSPRERDIGMVFQSYAVWPHMTVYQNVAYPLKYRRSSGGGDIAAKVRDTLELVGLGDYAQRSVTSLSGGQMQRVALARSLVYRPQLLLLDEPLSNLDAKLRIRLRDELRRILKQTGMTGLYVTHDQSEAVVLGDRIGVMREGKLLQMAPPDEIYNRPADPFVANFTGASNVLLGKVLARSGDKATIDLGAAGRIEAWTPQPLSPGDKARVALRAENVRLGERGPANAFSGRITERRYQGMQTVYDVEFGGQRVEVLELGTAARHTTDGEIALTLPPDQCWAYRDEGQASVD
ncbi:MAG: ABC transporter ATP-binding protein [Reyranella sp.]|uniref:ABC transporter ATP-binding protein n=1 Tax=Reyranella sp. TaxID=1929291 RepID=UPI0011F7E7A9|nr:ABC transporter ATP-binding protein [Reyranella sp.]TAJ40683.1 MAG: ABC transporter ATP-binding protein [Reyranella sp.]